MNDEKIEKKQWFIKTGRNTCFDTGLATSYL
jgi:hypothetical protein